MYQYDKNIYQLYTNVRFSDHFLSQTRYKIIILYTTSIYQKKFLLMHNRHGIKFLQ